ncbi:NAD(P)-binding protein [Panus rudis PR-1116 ss-1]|nr:NAD(P)-binding protein [Panus rudis PR-1116 ss-1]
MADLLVLGATGFTGKLITKYLFEHPEKSKFSFAIAGRSKSKLEELKRTLRLDDSVRVIQVDVSSKTQLDEVIKQAKVVINTVGPFYLYSTPVVEACARNGTHYVDLSGEPHWTHDIIFEYDYLATKTGSVIIPSAGYDSIPSDLAVYLSYKHLKSVSPNSSIEYSVNAHKVRGGFSGGTIATLLSSLENLSWKERAKSAQDWYISMVQGPPQTRPKLLYKLPFSNPPVYGALSPMASINCANVQRTWGLFEHVKRSSRDPVTTQQLPSYGPKFKFEEFFVRKSLFQSIVFSLGLITFVAALMIPPVRWFAKFFLPKPGEGPSEDVQKRGYLELTNITTSSDHPAKNIRTIIKGRGDPGYSLTAVMISEAALSLLLDNSELPAFSDTWRKNSEYGVGGILTPVTALGEVLVRRLEKTGRMTFSTEVVDERESESRKYILYT